MVRQLPSTTDRIWNESADPKHDEWWLENDDRGMHVECSCGSARIIGAQAYLYCDTCGRYWDRKKL